jgi:type I restriction enzyme S subunit
VNGVNATLLAEYMIPLGKIATCQYGLSEKSDPSGERLYIGMGQLQAGRVVHAGANRLTVSAATGVKYALHLGDVLFNRTNSFDLVGKTAIVRDQKLVGAVFASYLVRFQVDKTRYDSRFLNLWMNTRNSAARLMRLASPGVAQFNIRPSLLAEKFLVPNWSVKKQQEVANVDDKFERIAGELDTLIDSKRTFKRGLMQQLLAGKQRFQEFRNRQWTLGRFDQLCEELSDRNGKRFGADSVMGVIKDSGFEPMRNRVRGKGDLTRYKVVPTGAFAYNPMRLNIGSIAYNNLGRPILVSPDYEVFRVRVGIAQEEFVNQLRFSGYWRSFMKRAGAGSVRVRIYFSDLARLRVPTPDVDEQERISSVLRVVDSEIDLLAALREQVELQRRSLLSRLLSGDLKVLA